MENIQDLTALMDNIRQKKAAIKFDLKQIEDEEKKVEIALKGQLKELNVDTMEVGVYSFGYKETSRTAFDQKLFGEFHPDLLEKFKVETKSRKFVFKINSGVE